MRALARSPQTATGKKSLIKRREERGGDFLEVYLDGRSPMAQTFRKLIWRMGGRERFRSRLHVHGNICAEWKYGSSLGSLDAAMGHGLPGTIIFFRGPIWKICQNQKVAGTYLAAITGRSGGRKSTRCHLVSFTSLDSRQPFQLGW